MTDQVLSAICLVGGMVAIGWGVRMTARCLKQARQARRKTAWISATMPEGWGVWFVERFSTMTMGVSLLASLFLLAACALLGVGLVSVGCSLAR